MKRPYWMDELDPIAMGHYDNPDGEREAAAREWAEEQRKEAACAEYEADYAAEQQANTNQWRI
jgi:hypothetical protein